MLIDGAIGAISGAVAGAGKGTKHLMKLGAQTVKRTVKTVFQEAKSAAVYYFKSARKYYKKFIEEIPKDVAGSFFERMASKYLCDEY